MLWTLRRRRARDVGLGRSSKRGRRTPRGYLMAGGGVSARTPSPRPPPSAPPDSRRRGPSADHPQHHEVGELARFDGALAASSKLRKATLPMRSRRFSSTPIRWSSPKRSVLGRAGVFFCVAHQRTRLPSTPPTLATTLPRGSRRWQIRTPVSSVAPVGLPFTPPP